MKEALLEWRHTVIAIQTRHGSTFEGYLKKVEAGCIFVEVSGKGTFCCDINDVCLAVQVAQVALAKELKVN